jgi:hypothetical protein
MPRFYDRAGSASDSRKRHRRCCLPLLSTASAPRNADFAAQLPSLHDPYRRFAAALADGQRTAQGHRGSLLLRCRELSSPSSCRFIPALSESPLSRIERHPGGAAHKRHRGCSRAWCGRVGPAASLTDVVQAVVSRRWRSPSRTRRVRGRRPPRRSCGASRVRCPSAARCGEAAAAPFRTARSRAGTGLRDGG